MTDVRPFLVPSPDSISASKWEHLVEGEREELADHVPDWDQRTVLDLASTLTADCDAIRAATGLDDSARLVWSASWRATDTGLVGHPTLVDFGDKIVDFSLTIPPERVGAAIAVGRRLLLAEDREYSKSGQACHAGSVLWSDEHQVRLAGDGAAFPTEIVDFAHLDRDPRTSWYLELPDQVDAPAMCSMLLVINAADTALVDAVTRSRRRTDLHNVLTQEMEEGVIEELVRWTLARWDEIEYAEDDTVGAAARSLTTRILPDPSAWVTAADSMALRAAILGGARQLGFGRSIV